MANVTLQRRWIIAAVLAALACLPLCPSLVAAPSQGLARTTRPEDLARQALACEQRGEWLEACRRYDEAVRKDRGRTDCREGYLRCLRRYQLERRHRDPDYRQAVARLAPPQALDVYEQVLATVASTYVDRQKATWPRLFRHGLEELRFALEDEAFRAEYLADAPAAALQAFKDRLAGWKERKLSGRSEAREQVLAVVRAAQKAGVALPPPALTAVALEFAAGACNALDEYTLFLTPAAYGDAQATLQGRFVAVGVDLAVVHQKLEVSRVYPHSPAQEAGLLPHDRVLRIDRRPVDNLPADLAAERLRGEPGTLVEMEIVRGDMPRQTVKLVRRPVVVPSVEHEILMAPDVMESVPVGWLRVSSFQESTVQEVKEALATLQTYGARALVLDLRGNPGGLFKPAVRVAELFLGAGVIVVTQSQFKEYNRPYKANIANPLLLPMVVLIDGDTASAAEVVAGALKEHRRATLLGQTTFGKGSIQCLIPLDRPPLDRKPGGIRITVARFYSPARHPYSGHGVLPDVAFDPDNEAALRNEAFRLLLDVLRPMVPR